MLNYHQIHYTFLLSSCYWHKYIMVDKEHLLETLFLYCHFLNLWYLKLIFCVGLLSETNWTYYFLIHCLSFPLSSNTFFRFYVHIIWIIHILHSCLTVWDGLRIWMLYIRCSLIQALLWLWHNDKLVIILVHPVQPHSFSQKPLCWHCDISVT